MEVPKLPVDLLALVRSAAKDMVVPVAFEVHPKGSTRKCYGGYPLGLGDVQHRVYKGMR